MILNQLIELARSLQFKTYVLSEIKIKEFFGNFLSKPYEFKSFSLHTIFTICHLILETMGLLEIEQQITSKENVYKEC